MSHTVRGIDVDSRAAGGEYSGGITTTAIMRKLTAARQAIVLIAEKAIPGIRTFKIPTGFQVEKGPDAVVELIKENLPAIIGPSSPKNAL